jgi:hypothetical protein
LILEVLQFEAFIHSKRFVYFLNKRLRGELGDMGVDLVDVLSTVFIGAFNVLHFVGGDYVMGLGELFLF